MQAANDNSPPWPRGLSRSRAACYVGVSLTIWDRMVEAGEMPKAKRTYGRVLWDKLAVDRAFDTMFGTASDGETIYEFAA